MKRLPIILLSLLALCSCKRDRMQYCIEGQQFTVEFFSPRIAHVSVAPEGAGLDHRRRRTARAPGTVISDLKDDQHGDDFIMKLKEDASPCLTVSSRNLKTAPTATAAGTVFLI